MTRYNKSKNHLEVPDFKGVSIHTGNTISFNHQHGSRNKEDYPLTQADTLLQRAEEI